MEYLRDIIFAALFCGIITSVSSISGSGTAKHVRYVCGIIFLFLIVSPFVNKTTYESEYIDGLKGITSGTKFAETDNDLLKELISREICNAAIKNASEYFEVDKSSFSISIVLKEGDAEEYSIEEATIYTSGEGDKLNKDKIKLHFEKILNCGVKVVSYE